MILDISSYNGDIDFDLLMGSGEVERFILRSTIKSGDFDCKFLSNLNAIIKCNPNIPIDCYKFTYARNYNEAAMEAFELVQMLKASGVSREISYLWLDIEPVNGHVHTMRECAEIIAAYAIVCREYAIAFGIYCNYSYAKGVIPKWAKNFPMWLARWTDGDMGDVSPFDVFMWQYTSKGRVPGIEGVVDLSRYVGSA